eukprot:scaffold87340_cov18-Tisochrysis_lutea.AAC.1
MHTTHKKQVRRGGVVNGCAIASRHLGLHPFAPSNFQSKHLDPNHAFVRPSSRPEIPSAPPGPQ